MCATDAPEDRIPRLLPIGRHRTASHYRIDTAGCEIIDGMVDIQS